MDSEQCLDKSFAIQILSTQKKNTGVRNPMFAKLGSFWTYFQIKPLLFKLTLSK